LKTIEVLKRFGIGFALSFLLLQVSAQAPDSLSPDSNQIPVVSIIDKSDTTLLDSVTTPDPVDSLNSFSIDTNQAASISDDSLKNAVIDDTQPLLTKPVEEPKPNETKVVKTKPKPKPKALLASFVKYKSNHDPKTVYFNVLRVENNTNKAESFYVKVLPPDGWNTVFNLAGRQKVTLKPGEKKSFPVRLSSPRLIRGGLAYVVSAELVDGDDNLLTPIAFAYVNIPKKSAWKLTTDNRYHYVRDNVQFEKVRVKVENSGNAEETIKLSIKVGRKLKIVGIESKSIEMGITIQPRTDSIVELMIRYVPDYLERPHFSDNRVVVQAVNGDITTPQILSIFFEQVHSIHENDISETQSPLTVWLMLSNLMSNSGSILLAGGADGHLLFPKGKSLSYSFANSRIFGQINENIPILEQYYRFSRMVATWRDANYSVSIGDISSNTGGIGSQSVGRGISGDYQLGRQRFFAFGTRNIFTPIWYFGGGYSNLFKQIQFRTSVNYQIDNFRDVNSAGLNISAATRIKSHGIGFGIQPTYADFKSFTITGMGTLLNYRFGSKDKLKVNFQNRYNTDDFANGVGEQFTSNLNVFYKLLGKHNFNFTYGSQLLEPIFYDVNKVKTSLGSRDFHITSLLYSKRVAPRVLLNTGPTHQYYFADNPISLSPEVISRNYMYYLGVTRRGEKQGHSVSGNISVGLSDITQFDLNGNRIDLDPYINTTLRLSARVNRGGILFSYFLGAPSFTSIQFYRGAGKDNKSVRINPYYRFAFLDNKLQLNTNISWWYQLNDNSLRTSAYADLLYRMKKGWSVNANLSYYGFNKSDEELGRQSFRDINMTFGLRKTFDIKQPRAKYYDLKLVFFKDKNGNRTKDSNEVGISDVLVSIQMEIDSVKQGAESGYGSRSANLITNEFGQVQCIRILEGNYHVKANPLKQPGEYTSLLGDEFDAYLGENLTMYVPFIKSNKLFGRVIIKRDPYSSLGHVSPSNIAVTAVDSMGNTYKALTDNYGNFLIFAPQAGRYTVRLNNVYANNFKLRQKEFVIDFNGLKEFKVTFMLEETKRKINFKGDINGFNFSELKLGSGEGDGGAGNTNEPEIQETPIEKPNENENSEPEDNRLNNNNSPIIQEKKLDEIPRPIRPEDISFTVQAAVYKTDDHPEIAEIMKLRNVQRSKTPEGLTRYTVGAFDNFDDAKIERDRIAALNIQDNDEFVVVIARYKDHILTADEAKAILGEEHGPFSKVEDITLPLNKNYIKFRVQLGAYDLSKDHPEINQIRKLNDLSEMKTPEGLTRFVIGEYGTIEEAKSMKEQLIEKNIVPDPNFIIVIGQYKAHIITAEEALLLLEK
jgi:hypothetical protein